MGKLKIVSNGAGAAGIAIGKHLINMGFGNVIMCDMNGMWQDLMFRTAHTQNYKLSISGGIPKMQ